MKKTIQNIFGKNYMLALSSAQTADESFEGLDFDDLSCLEVALGATEGLEAYEQNQRFKISQGGE